MSLKSKARSIVRWTPLVVAVAFLIATSLSFFATMSVRFNWGTQHRADAYSAMLYKGRIIYYHSSWTRYDDSLQEEFRIAKKRVTFEHDFAWTKSPREIIGGRRVAVDQMYIPEKPRYSSFSIPLVSTTILLLILCAALNVKRYTSWRRKRAGCCVECGYSLKGLDGGVCPECGEGAEDMEESKTTSPCHPD